MHRFFAIVLLPAVRDDIRANRRLNYHLYYALKKALYKPGAFMKGVLIPLCEVRVDVARTYAYVGGGERCLCTCMCGGEPLTGAKPRVVVWRFEACQVIGCHVAFIAVRPSFVFFFVPC